MKWIVSILFIFISLNLKAQSPTQTIPNQYSTGVFRWGWPRADSGFVNAVRDVFNARYPGSQIVRIQGGDTAFWFGAGGNLWYRNLLGKDTNSISNRINLKLNTSDTANKWLGLGSRFADTLYRINDSTVGYTIKGASHSFQILGRSQGGGGGSGTVTSVGLTAPAAFSVSGGPITSSGNINLSASGTSLQYIKGNGTLATTDTTMIPNFYLKSRGLINGSSPLVYNNFSGSISIQNATASGQKGAATFVNSSFSDNGSGTIDLADVTTAGNCTNCNVTYDSKGRATSYANGTGASVNARRSVTKATLDSLQFVNDTTLNTATGKYYTYQVDTTGRRAYYEDKYVIGKTFAEIRNLRIPDTSYIFRVNVGGVVGDYKYDPSDGSTTDDTVITIVSTAGYRYKRYILNAVFDPKWWGAKANGSFDDTKAVQGAINALYKYTLSGGFGNGQAATLLLHGNYKIDAAQLVYPGFGAVDANVQIKGNINLLSTWTLPSRWNLIGEGNPSNYAQFHEGVFASITTAWTNSTSTPQPAISLINGSQLVKNLSISSSVGIGIEFNGTQVIPAALSTIENVFVGCSGYTGGEQIGIYISDWFWARIIRCSSTVEQAAYPNKPGSAVKIVGETVGDANFTYLLSFDHLITQGRPIRIQSLNSTPGPPNVPIFNVSFKNCVFENLQFDTACVIANSNNIGISNMLFEMCSMADCDPNTYFLKNVGPYTNGVTFNQPFDRLLYTGDPINGLVINSAYNVYPAYPHFFKDYVFSSGAYDGRNKNRAWKPPFDLTKYSGGQIARNASLLASAIGGGSTAPFTGYNGDTIAIKIPVAGDITFKQFNQQFHTGDRIFWGCWLKMDSIAFGSSFHANFSFGSKYKFKETSSANFDDVSYEQVNDTWQFISIIATIQADTTNVDQLNVGMRIADSFDTTYISNAFVYFIDSSQNVSNDELVGWAKEHMGGTYGVPVGSYAIRDDARTYFGDSTYFNPSTRKFYGTTKIQYTSGDSLALVTKKYVDNLTGSGITSLNGLTTSTQTFATGTSGSDFNISSATSTHTFNLPNASATARGVVSTGSQTFAGSKLFTSAAAIVNFSSNANAIFSVDLSGGGKAVEVFSNVGCDLNFRKGAGTDYGTFSFYTGSTRTHYISSYGDGTWRLTRDATANDIVIDGSSNIGLHNASPSATLHQVGSTRFDLGSDATGDVFYRNSSGNFTRLAIGSSGNILTVSGGLPSWAAPASVTALYSGDGALAANRTISGAGFALTADNITNFRVNADAYIFAKKNATIPFTGSIVGAGNIYEFGYTPTATVFTKGAGLYIDTNNNVGLAITIPTTIPLYAAGNSAYVQGFQSNAGNFYRVDSITTNVTANLTEFAFRINATGGNITITLPAASTAFGDGMGIVYMFKRLDNSGNTVTIQAAGADLIDGSASFTLTTQYQSKTIQCSSSSAWDIR